MRNREKMEVNGIIAAHNFFLSGLSLCMSVGVGEYARFGESELARLLCDVVIQHA